MAYISFTQLIQFDEKRFVDKYIVPANKVPVGFADDFVGGDLDVQDTLDEWGQDEAIIKLTTGDSVHATGTCLVMPPYLFIEREYISFLWLN